MTLTVPIQLARDAYLAEEIEADEYEALLEAAHAGQEVDASLALQNRAYMHLQQQVRFTSTPVSPVTRLRLLP